MSFCPALALTLILRPEECPWLHQSLLPWYVHPSFCPWGRGWVSRGRVSELPGLHRVTGSNHLCHVMDTRLLPVDVSGLFKPPLFSFCISLLPPVCVQSCVYSQMDMDVLVRPVRLRVPRVAVQKTSQSLPFHPYTDSATPSLCISICTMVYFASGNHVNLLLP